MKKYYGLALTLIALSVFGQKEASFRKIRFEQSIEKKAKTTSILVSENSSRAIGDTLEPT